MLLSYIEQQPSMALALTRSIGSMQRLANQTALPGILFASFVQPASITSLLAWHSKHVTDHRKLYSSDDKQQRPQQAAPEQTESSNASASTKPQQSDPNSAPGIATWLFCFLAVCTCLHQSLSEWTIPNHTCDTTYRWTNKDCVT